MDGEVRPREGERSYVLLAEGLGEALVVVIEDIGDRKSYRRGLCKGGRRGGERGEGKRGYTQLIKIKVEENVSDDSREDEEDWRI